MSRSGYSDDIENWSLIRWRGQVTSAIRGKRGQTFLRELLAALEAMPNKRLITHELREGGEMCALGALGAQRGLPLEEMDPDDPEVVAAAFGVAPQLVQEIVYKNDEDCDHMTPDQRWDHMRGWVKAHIKEGRGHDPHS